MGALIHMHMAQDCNCTKQNDIIGSYVLRTLRVTARAQATLGV
jgi:hypothetical protein